MNFRTKFNIASAGLISVVVFGMMVSLYTSEKNLLWREIEEEQHNDLTKLAEVCEKSMIWSEELVLINYVKTLLLSPKFSLAGFNNPDGSGWIYSRKKQFELSNANDELVKSIVSSNGLLRREMVGENDEKLMALSIPVGNRGFVRLAYSRKVVNQIFQGRIQDKGKRLFIVGLFSLFLGLLLANILSRALARPVRLLMDGAEEIAKGNKGVLIPVQGKDELAHLTSTFNHMSKELAKLDELKDDFMSHVTHELRSPLTSIIATVELMSEMSVVNKDEKLKRSVDRLTYGSERLNKLVDNILDLMKMQAGKMTFDIKPTNMGVILMEMADFFEPRAQEKGLQIRAVVTRNLPIAMADAERIRQVLSNLIHNAVKFTNRGEIILWAKQQDHRLIVGVQDTGVGIPKDKLKSVFEKFESLADTRNRVDKPVPGSGLGLNIVMNSIRAQGGTIWVESEIDKGSTFLFTLPLASAQVQAQHLSSMEMKGSALENKLSHTPAVANAHWQVLRTK